MMDTVLDKMMPEWLNLMPAVPPCGLIDAGLEGVDPFQPDLSTDMKFRIWQEAKANPRYFFMVILRASPGEIAEIDRHVIDVLDKFKL